MQEKSTQPRCRISTLFAEASLARPFQSLEEGTALPTPEEPCSLRSLESLKPKDLAICSLRMFPACYRMTGAGRLRSSSTRWMSWGTTSHGRCLTAKISAFPNPAIACTLSDRILETNRISLTTAVSTFARLALYQQEESYGMDGMNAIIQMHRDPEPIAYLLRACDEIQCWDRKSFSAPISGRAPLDGNRLSLQGEDDSLTLRIEDSSAKASISSALDDELLWDLCEERRSIVLHCIEKHRTDSDFNVALSVPGSSPLASEIRNSPKSP